MTRRRSRALTDVVGRGARSSFLLFKVMMLTEQNVYCVLRVVLGQFAP